MSQIIIQALTFCISKTITKSFRCILQRETGIADDAQGIVRILTIEFQGLLVCSSQNHLWTTSHSHRGGMAVQGFLGEVLALFEDVIIKVRQYRTIESDGVFHQENHLHTCLLDVVLQIHLILYQLDDGENEIGVAQPTKHVVEDAQVLIFHSLGNAMGKWGQHHAMDIRELGLHVTSHIKGIIVGIARHTNDQVDIRGTQHLGCLLGSRNLGKGRRITKSQFDIFIIDFLLNTPIVLQHKGIIRISNYQDIINATHHQIDK